MGKFFKSLLSDSNRQSSKRLIGLLMLVMFIAYGIKGLLVSFNLHFSIFYCSLATITIWIGFKFMSSEKILKYNVISQLTKFKDGAVGESVQNFVKTETDVDGAIQPESDTKDTTKIPIEENKPPITADQVKNINQNEATSGEEE